MRAGWGVLLEVVAAITALNLLFSIWLMRILSLQIQQAVADLDSMLAKTIQSLIEKGIGDFEPVNPIQAAIAQMLTSNLSQNRTSGDVIEVVRDVGGKFT